MRPARPHLGHPERNLEGILFVLVAVFAFTLQDVIIKFLSGDYSIHQLVLSRCLGALPIVLAFLIYEGSGRAFFTAPHGLIILRSAIQYVSYVLWFLAIAAMSIADALAIGFVSPLIITALSSLVLGAQVGLRHWLAILAGFAGTVLMLRPGIGVFEPAALLVLASAICYAFGAILTRKIAAVASSATMSLNSLLLAITLSGLAGIFAGGGSADAGGHPSLQLMLRGWKMPDAHDAALMLATGIAAGIGMLCMTQAYRMSQPAIVAPFEYTAMFWALIAGYVIWSQSPDTISVVGIMIIVGAGLYIASLERRRRAELSRTNPA